MHFVIMNEDFFSAFANNHENANLYQTKEYARLMNSAGFNIEYIGVVDNSKTILAAALVLTQTVKSNKYAYIPGGIIIDYNHTALLSFFVDNLKRHLSKQKIVFIKTDFALALAQYKPNGDKIGPTNNFDIVEILKSLGFNHYGFNNYFETLKPRWTAVIEPVPEVDALPHKTNPVAGYKINRAKEKGISIYKGSHEYIDDFYDLIKDKMHRRNLGYYQNWYNIYGKNNGCDIYFAVLDPATFSNNARSLYEMEIGINDDLATQLEQATQDDREEILNKKMESDKKLVIYKNDINDSISLMKLYPQGVKIATLATIKYNNQAFFLIDGVLDKFRKFYPKHLLYSKVIEEYARAGYTKISLNAVTGVFNSQDQLYRLHDFKGAFSTHVIEHPGEFDLILNQLAYFKLSNTPEFKDIIKKQTK